MSQKKVVGHQREVADPFALYRITETLGEGSYGKVYKAIHVESGEVQAVKVVHVEEDVSEVEVEIDFLKTMDSPWILKYFDSFLHASENDLWIVIEYCAGGAICDCTNVLDRSLREPELATVVAETVRGLAYLHGQKKIHRDIKAGNILLTSSGRIKLADFGVSAQLTASISKRCTIIGTPYWMAPEVIQETAYDQKADIWSLGITMLELGEGKPPLAGIHPMRAIFMIPSKPPPRFTDPDAWSPEMNDFLARCLVKDATKRKSARELLNHPLVRNAPPPESLQVLLEQVSAVFAKYGGRDAYDKFMREKREAELQAAISDDGFSSSSSSSDSSSDDYGTMRGTGTEMWVSSSGSSSDFSSGSDTDSDVVVRSSGDESSSGSSGSSGSSSSGNDSFSSSSSDSDTVVIHEHTRRRRQRSRVRVVPKEKQPAAAPATPKTPAPKAPTTKKKPLPPPPGEPDLDLSRRPGPMRGGRTAVPRGRGGRGRGGRGRRARPGGTAIAGRLGKGRRAAEDEGFDITPPSSADEGMDAGGEDGQEEEEIEKLRPAEEREIAKVSRIFEVFEPIELGIYCRKLDVELQARILSVQHMYSMKREALEMTISRKG